MTRCQRWVRNPARAHGTTVFPDPSGGDLWGFGQLWGWRE
jgi:hypothetical protein